MTVMMLESLGLSEFQISCAMILLAAILVPILAVYLTPSDNDEE